MPIILKRKYDFKGNYSDEEKEKLKEFVELFRTAVGDDIPENNILYKKMYAYTDGRIIGFLKKAMNDINGGKPTTKYTIFSFEKKHGSALIIDGAIVFSLIAEGLFQLRNQVDFNDSGLSIGLFNKTQIYQSWAGFLLNNYLNDKQAFKSSIVVEDSSSMFHGISSEFAYFDGYYNGDDYY